METFIWTVIILELVAMALSLIKFGREGEASDIVGALIQVGVALWGYSVLP